MLSHLESEKKSRLTKKPYIALSPQSYRQVWVKRIGYDPDSKKSHHSDVSHIKKIKWEDLHHDFTDADLKKIAGNRAELFMATLQDKKVVIKFFDPREEKSFFSAVGTMSRLTSEYVVKLDGIVQSEGDCVTALVMEYCENGTLRQKLDSSDDISDEEKFKWLRQICLAMIKIHEFFIHGDIKCANILLDQKNNIKICDFDGSILISSGWPTNIVQLRGTYAYLAPERALGKCTTKSDIYSFGIVLWEIMTRKNFHPNRSIETQANLLKTNPMLYDLFIQCTAAQPDQRPSAQGIIAILDKPLVKRCDSPSLSIVTKPSLPFVSAEEDKKMAGEAKMLSTHHLIPDRPTIPVRRPDDKEKPANACNCFTRISSTIHAFFKFPTSKVDQKAVSLKQGSSTPTQNGLKMR